MLFLALAAIASLVTIYALFRLGMRDDRLTCDWLANQASLVRQIGLVGTAGGIWQAFGASTLTQEAIAKTLGTAMGFTAGMLTLSLIIQVAAQFHNPAKQPDVAQGAPSQSEHPASTSGLSDPFRQDHEAARLIGHQPNQTYIQGGNRDH